MWKTIKREIPPRNNIVGTLEKRVRKIHRGEEVKLRDMFKDAHELKPSWRLAPPSSPLRTMLKVIRDMIVKSNTTSLGRMLMNHLENTQRKTGMLTLMEINLLSLKLARMIPKGEFDLVVGVPRTGMPTAIMVALCHGTAYATMNEICNGLVNRKRSDKGEYKKVLVADDSIGTGEHLETAISMIKNQYPEAEIKTAVLFKKRGHHAVQPDFCVAETDAAIGFEMDMNRQKHERVGIDMDGVIAQDDKYLGVRICDPDVIATGRMEYIRGKTEEWLSLYKFRYGKLVMRKNGETPVQTKVKAILDNNLTMFIESEPNEALLIYILSGVKTFCTGDGNYYGGTAIEYKGRL